MANADVLKRVRQARQVRRDLAARRAADAIGDITPGCEIFGLSKGHYSLIDIIEHCLSATGPADVVLVTWTTGVADLNVAYGMLADGRIRSMRFVVDFSFPTRQPEYCAALRERFGDDCIRLTKTHAKLVTICNERWNIVIRSSMNLNENRRVESFEISDDAAMADWIGAVMGKMFEQPTGVCFENTPYKNVLEFEKFGEGADAIVDESEARRCNDVKKHFGDGRYSTDIRRAGLRKVG